jgi:hypothetical protein
MDALAALLPLLSFLLLPLALGATVDTDWIEVFRAGEYPQGTFTAEEVQRIAARSSESAHEAPVTTDHQQAGPAFGWVDKIRAKAGRLWVKLKNVPEGFAEALNERRFHTRSIELFPGESGQGEYLKAVSFLGAKAPQVKGLEPVGEISFTEAQLAEETVTLNFDEEAQPGEEEIGDDPDDAVSDPEDEEADPSDPDTEDDEEAEQQRPGAPARRNSDAGEEEDEPEGEDEEEEEQQDFADASDFAAMRQELAQAQSENQRLRAEQTRLEREQAAQDFEQFCSETVPPRVRDRAKAVFFALKGAEEDGALTTSFAHEDHDSALACFKDLLDDLSFGHLFGTFAEDGPTNDHEGSADDLGDAVRESMAEQGHV